MVSKTVILKSYHIYYMGPAKNCESVILTCQNSFEKNSRCVKLLWQYVPRESAAFMMHRRHFKLLFCIGRVLFKVLGIQRKLWKWSDILVRFNVGYKNTIPTVLRTACRKYDWKLFSATAGIIKVQVKNNFWNI